jgi:hypothetical protein
MQLYTNSHNTGVILRRFSYIRELTVSTVSDKQLNEQRVVYVRLLLSVIHNWKGSHIKFWQTITNILHVNIHILEECGHFMRVGLTSDSTTLRALCEVLRLIYDLFNAPALMFISIN